MSSDMNKFRTIGTSISGINLVDDQDVWRVEVDSSSQTDVTEIYSLKESKEFIKNLRSEITLLKSDASGIRSKLEVSYEKKVKQISSKLFQNSRQRESEVKRLHREKLESLKHTFRQRLSDALVKLSVEFEKNLEFNIGKVRSHALKEREKEIELLRHTLHRDADTIESLKARLRYLRAKFAEDETAEENDESIAKFLQSSDSEIDRKDLEEEIRNLKLKIPSLKKRIVDLRDCLEEKISTTMKQKKEVGQLRDKLSLTAEMSRLLSEEKVELKGVYDIKQHNLQVLLKKKRLEWEKIIAEKVLKAKKRVIADAKKDSKNIHLSGAMQCEIIEEETNEIKAKIKKLTDRRKYKTKEEIDIEALIASNHEKTIRMESLARELEEARRAWEKEYVVLQQTVNTVREARFTRATVPERPTAELRTATVSYYNEKPKGIIQAVPRFCFRREPLLSARLHPLSPTRVSVLSDASYHLSSVN